MCACAIAHAIPSGSGWPRSAMSTCLPFAAPSASANARARGSVVGDARGRQTPNRFGHRGQNCGHGLHRQIQAVTARCERDTSRPRRGRHAWTVPTHRQARETREGKMVASRPGDATLDGTRHGSRSRACCARSSPRSRSRCRRSSGWRTRRGARRSRRSGATRASSSTSRGRSRTASATTATSATSTGRSRTSSTGVFLALGGADEHRFRVLDLVVTGATFALVGACLPGLRARRAPERRSSASRGRSRRGSLLSGQYLLYGYWDLAQRESFFDWFLLPSRRAPARRAGERRQERAAKPQSRKAKGWGAAARRGRRAQRDPLASASRRTRSSRVAQLLALVAGRRAGRAAAAGAAARSSRAAALGRRCRSSRWLVATRGRRARTLRIQLVDVPAMYRFIWPRAAADIFSNPW